MFAYFITLGASHFIMMAYFPVTNSNLSAVHLGLFLQEKYALRSPVTCRLVKAGVNDTYFITSGQDKFVFRIYSFNWRTYTEIEAEINLLNELKDHQIPVSYPIEDTGRQYIQTLNAPEGDRYGVLFTFAEGEKQHISPAETHFEIGKLMARLHAVTVGRQAARVNYTPEVILTDPLKKIAGFLSESSEEMKFMRGIQKYLLTAFENADVSQIRKGIVHLDIWFDNLNISTDNKIVLFDFDFCGNGWLALDIAYYILQLHNCEKYEEKIYAPKVESFLRGYESITSISAEERRLLPVLGVSLYFFYLGVQCQRYDNWSNSFLNENYLKRFIVGLVKRYYEIYLPANP